MFQLRPLLLSTLVMIASACNRSCPPPVAPTAPAATAVPAIEYVVSFKVQPGKEAEARALMSDVVEKVKANEGVLVYQFFQAAADPLLFVVVEMYRDDAAFQQNEALLATFRPRMIEVLDISTLAPLVKLGARGAGFIR